MKKILYQIPNNFKKISRNSSNHPHYRLDFIRLIKETLDNDLLDECVVTENSRDSYDIRFEHHVRRDSPSIIDYKQNYLPPLFYFGCGGYSGWARHIRADNLNRQQDQTKVEQFYDERIQSLHGFSRYKQLNTVESEIPNEFILVATQVESDTVMKLKRIETREIIDRALKVAKNLNLPLVIKNHPLEKNNFSVVRYSKALAKHYSFVYISKGDIIELIQRAKGVFVTNSGVGFETLCYLKPLFIFGQSDYEEAAYECLNHQTITKVIQNELTDKHLIKQFLYNYYQWIIDVRYEEESRQKIANRIRAKL